MMDDWDDILQKIADDRKLLEAIEAELDEGKTYPMRCNIETAKKHGKDLQTTVAMEECSELIQAISKIKRYGENMSRRQHLIDEIADVELCIEQLKYFYIISDREVQWMKRYKVRRELQMDEHQV